MAPRAGRFGPAAITFAFTCLLALAPAWAGAQVPEKARTNPLQGNATAIKQGKNIYRGRCGVCHGIDAKGYRGSDLTTGDWVHGGSDGQIFQTIRAACLRHRDARQPEHVGGRNLDGDHLPPDAERTGRARAPSVATRRSGEQLFWAKESGNCGQCHMIGAARRAHRPEPLAHRRGPIGSRPRTRNAAARRGDSSRLRDRHGGHAATASGFAARARTRTRSRCR